MGLGNNGASRTYLSISDGKIAKRCNENEVGAIKCTNKDGTNTWYELRYANVSGYIKDVVKKVSENTKFGPQLQIVIEDDGETFQLQMPWSGSYSNGFFLCMPNIDLSKKVRFSPWMKVIDNSKKTALYLSHEGEADNIAWAWTRDEPKDLPPMQRIKVKGVETWDDTARQEYFERYIRDVFKPRLDDAVKKHKVSTPVAETAKPQATPIQVPTNEDDDLPF